MERPERGSAGERHNIWELTSDLAFSTRVAEDGSMEVEWVTEAFVRDFDLDRPETARLGVLSLVHRLDLPRAEEGLERIRSGREWVTELRLTARDGTLRWVRLYARPVLDPSTEQVVMIHGALREVTDRRQAELRLRRGIESLRRTEEERRMLLTRLAERQEQDRPHPAANPKDDPLGAMAAASRRLEALSREFADTHQAVALGQVDELIEQAVQQLRGLLVELRPPELDAEGLAAAVWAYMEQARVETGIDYRLENRLPGEPDDMARVLIYRILQEALANVRRHSRAEHVEVLLESRDDGIFVRVWDDGLGFAKNEVEPPRQGQQGISSMRGRAEMAGGWCRVDSLPALGTRVEFWVPLVPDTSELGALAERSDDLLSRPGTS